GVALADQLAAQVARVARHADVPLEAVVVRLQLVVAERPVLHVGALGQSVLPVALDVVAPVPEVAREEPPRLGRPVHTGAAEPLPGVERPEPADRQGPGPGVRAPGPGLLRDVEHHRLADAVVQRVVVVLEVRVGPACGATFERHDALALGGELLGEDSGGPAGAHRHDVHLGVHAGAHQRPAPCAAWSPSSLPDCGSTGSSRPVLRPASNAGRCSIAFGGRGGRSACISAGEYARWAPGHPISSHPTMSRFPPYIGSLNMPSIVCWRSSTNRSSLARSVNSGASPSSIATSTWSCCPSVSSVNGAPKRASL